MRVSHGVARLSKYVIYMLPTIEARVSRFVQRLSPLVINEASTTALYSDMNYGKMGIYRELIEPKQLHELFSVSTPVGESIMAARVYRDCFVTVHGRDTMANLIELGIVDFDLIMGMDWLYSCFSKLDCRTRTVRIEFPNESVIEWKGDDVVPKYRFISYLKATMMINKGCIYHLVWVTNTDAKALTLESVPAVNAILEVFPDMLLGSRQTGRLILGLM
ncbi:uncharacterized protein [Nicotiana tomentosiformis]|uniref:uncharacterized protein n=1 Tax=Nicotiana tomentosiformis TaxID=4098 RepID=UPI00388CB09F